MRILAVEPGPHFSTFDVHRGWVKALRGLGHEVADINFGDRIDALWSSHIEKNGEWVRAWDERAAFHLARHYVYADVFTFAPDMVLVTAGHFIDGEWLEVVRQRAQIPVALLCTESPYEDTRQFRLAPHADLVLLNDPTNIESFRKVNPNTHYVPHSYDPEVHHPRPAEPELKSDFAFVGTLYPERQAFLEAVDWSGIDMALGGNMTPLLNNDSPLLAHLVHHIDDCCPNDLTARVYASTKASVNLYRKQAEAKNLIDGWAMGPREIELAACGTFYLTEARGENRQVLPMLPTFTSPAEFQERLRWWLANDTARAEAAELAREAIATRTFTNHARQMVEMVEAL